MLIIAHRGNLEGPNPETENVPQHIDRVYSKYGFHSEIDLWATSDGLALGHDFPEHPIDLGWLHLRSNLLWIHCKNIEALVTLKLSSFEKDFNYFWHEEDAYTLTSKGYVWAYPGKKVPTPCKSIAVCPEITQMKFEDYTNFVGICTDYGVSYL